MIIGYCYCWFGLNGYGGDISQYLKTIKEISDFEINLKRVKRSRELRAKGSVSLWFQCSVDLSRPLGVLHSGSLFDCQPCCVECCWWGELRWQVPLYLLGFSIYNSFPARQARQYNVKWDPAVTRPLIGQLGSPDWLSANQSWPWYELLYCEFIT